MIIVEDFCQLDSVVFPIALLASSLFWMPPLIQCQSGVLISVQFYGIIFSDSCSYLQIVAVPRGKILGEVCLTLLFWQILVGKAINPLLLSNGMVRLQQGMELVSWKGWSLSHNIEEWFSTLFVAQAKWGQTINYNLPPGEAYIDFKSAFGTTWNFTVADRNSCGSGPMLPHATGWQNFLPSPERRLTSVTEPCVRSACPPKALWGLQRALKEYFLVCFCFVFWKYCLKPLRRMS